MSLDMFPQSVIDRIISENDLLYEAWGIIANVSEGDWVKQNDEWREAALQWRSKWHNYLGAKDASNSEEL